MALQLTRLRELHQDLIVNNKKRCKFKFAFNKVVFDIIYFIDETPYILMFGVLNRNFYFEVKVNENFEISTYLGNAYNELCNILDLKYDPNNSFKTNAFFSEFDRQSPRHYVETDELKPHHIAIYLKNEVEEGDKIYFAGWLNHGDSGKHYRPENLEKTKRLLGVEAYERCKKKNISSRWTDEATKMIEYTLLE